VKEDLPAVLGNTPGAEDSLARQPGVQPLGDAVDEEVGNGKLTEVAAGERFVFLPQPFGHLADGGATQHARAARIAEGRFDVPRAQAAGVHLHGELLQFGRPAGQARADTRHERFGAIGHVRTP
jgi:hypothetical protein